MVNRTGGSRTANSTAHYVITRIGVAVLVVGSMVISAWFVGECGWPSGKAAGLAGASQVAVTSWAAGAMPTESIILPRPSEVAVPRRLRLKDPRGLLAVASGCMVSAPQILACVDPLLLALQANTRQTQAALWLGQIASFAGNEELAGEWLRYARERDRSFAVQWAEWQFHHGLQRRQGGEWRPSPSGNVADLLRVAPVGASSHFEVLLAAGWQADALLALLQQHGRSAQVSTFLEYLARVRPSEAAGLLGGIARVEPSLRDHRFACRQLALRVTAGAITLGEGYTEAAILWRQMLVDPTPGCDPRESSGLPAKQANDTEDPVWNYNPLLRFPLLPRSFDWSAIQREGAMTRPMEGGGVRFTVSGSEEAEYILLARPLPPAGEAASIAIETVWASQADRRERSCGTPLTWEIRDRQGRQTLSSAPLAGPGVTGQQAGKMKVERVNLLLPAWMPGMQLILVASAARESCGHSSLAINSIRVTPQGKTSLGVTSQDN